MFTQKITSTYLADELSYVFSRSSGPGGQHVNKVNTRVTLRLDVANSSLLTDEEKAIIISKLGERITKGGVLILTSQAGRSQLANKERVVARLDSLLSSAFKIMRKRRATKPTKNSKERRLIQKKKQSEKKEGRRKL